MMQSLDVGLDMDAEIKQAQGWHAELALQFSDRGDKTVLKHKTQIGPLSIQRPLYPEQHICHVYLLHPPGGVVGGDSLNITAQLSSGAHTLVTTPGATKFYRSEQRLAKQVQTLTVADNATLEWLPQENIFFPDSHVQVDTHIRLYGSARFMGWELHCFGRPALDEVFTAGQLRGKTEIFIDDQRILTEQLRLNGGDAMFLKHGLQSFSMTGSFYITNQDEVLFSDVQDAIAQLQLRYAMDKLVIAVTQIEGLMVVRALGSWSEDILQVFGLIWQQVRRHWTGQNADLPRIWAT